VTFLPCLPRATRQARTGSDSRLGLYGVRPYRPFPGESHYSPAKSRCPEASPNFAITEFYEVRTIFVLWDTYS
jgi:hypothetical protein